MTVTGREYLNGLWHRMAHHLGLFRPLVRNRIGILMLHGVIDAQADSPWVPLRHYHSLHDFERILTTLATRYAFVSLDAAADMLAGRQPFRPNCLVLTFDDGYANNVELAQPVLQRLGIPATIFLCTAFMDKRRPMWFDRLDYVLQQPDIWGREVRVGCSAVKIRGGSREELSDSYRCIRRLAKLNNHPGSAIFEEMERLADELENACDRSLMDIYEADPVSRILTWEEARAANRTGLSFGSHTVDHARLGLVHDHQELDRQIRESKRVIEEHLGVTCHHLAYPNGSYSSAVVAAVRATGYQAAVTTLEGLNRRGCDPYRLRRIPFPVTRWSPGLFAIVAGSSSPAGFVQELGSGDPVASLPLGE